MKRRIKVVEIEGRSIPPELLDVDAVVWTDRRAHLDFMAERGWALDVRDRMGPGAPPAARRQAAAEGWAEEHGITTSPGGHADWHRLRAMGLYP